MRHTPSPRTLLVALATLLVTGCSAPGELQLELPTRFAEGARTGQRHPGTLSQRLGALTPVQSLYFGELEIVAYDHRPGAALQTGQHFGFTGTHDWSYWVVLQSGHDAARDNLLQPGQQIDIDALNADYNQGSAPSQDFVDQVGIFEIDAFEVYIHRTGVIYDNAYYGMNADFNGLSVHPLHKYPALATLPDTFCTPVYPGQPAGIQDLNVFFVRSDWFSSPTIVNTRQTAANPQLQEISSSSVPLTATQESLVLSLVNNGTRRRFYDNLLFIPFAGPVAVQLNPATPPPPSQPHQYQAGNFLITVHFDLTDIIDPATDWNIPDVRYKGDASNVPFGLTVSFDPL